MESRCLLLFVLIFSRTTFSVGFNISITPEKFTGKNGKDAKVSCTMNNEEVDAKEIVFIKVTRKGDKSIVILDENNTISYVAANEDEYKANGKIDETNIAKSFLNLNIIAPDTEDTGMYSCCIAYVDSAGETKEKKASKRFTVEDPEVKKLESTVKDLLDKVKKNQDNQKNKTDNEKQELGKVKDLENKTAKQMKELENLATKEKEFQGKVVDLENKTNTELKKILERSEKDEVQVKNLNETINQLMEKIKQDRNQTKKLEDLEIKDKTKIDDMEEKTKKQETLLDDLTEKEIQMETKLEALESQAEEQLEKMKEMISKRKTLETKLVALETKLKKFITKGRLSPTNPTQTKPNSVRGSNNGSGNNGGGNNGGGNNGGGNNGGDYDGGRKLNPQATPMIAFSATSESHILKPKLDEVIVLPDILLNTNGHYNPTTGIFTAPLDGLYSFQVLLKLNCQTCHLMTQLLLNANTLLRLKVGAKYDQNQGGASTVAKLYKGDQVKIVADYIDEDVSLTNSKTCIFSGFLVARI